MKIIKAIMASKKLLTIIGICVGVGAVGTVAAVAVINSGSKENEADTAVQVEIEPIDDGTAGNAGNGDIEASDDNYAGELGKGDFLEGLHHVEGVVALTEAAVVASVLAARGNGLAEKLVVMDDGGLLKTYAVAACGCIVELGGCAAEAVVSEPILAVVVDESAVVV